MRELEMGYSFRCEELRWPRMERRAMANDMGDPEEMGLPRSLLSRKKEWDRVVTVKTFWSFEWCASHLLKCSCFAPEKEAE